MKLGVLIPVRPETDLEAQFKKAREMELDSCQISIWDMSLYTEENAAKINALCRETGLEVSVLWAGWSGPKEWNFTYGPETLGLVPAAYRGTRLADLEKGSEFAAKIGVKYVATHVGFLPENMNDPDYVGTIGALRSLCKLMKTRDQVFLFETGQETPVTMLRAIEDIGADNVGINFDTANVILYGKANPVDSVRIFGKYVRQTHIKDCCFPTDGRHLGKEMPVGEGLVDFKTVMKELKDLGYEGHYTIEREISGDEQIRDILRARDMLRAIDKEI